MKNMSFVIKDDDVPNKYNDILDKTKETLSIKFHSTPVFDEKCIIVKVREFNGVIKANLLGDKVHKENEHYTCIACITIDSVENGKEKLSPGLFRRMQIQNEKDKNDQILRS